MDAGELGFWCHHAGNSLCDVCYFLGNVVRRLGLDYISV